LICALNAPENVSSALPGSGGGGAFMSTTGATPELEAVAFDPAGRWLALFRPQLESNTNVASKSGVNRVIVGVQLLA
jgi:hypothetical protein